jgi:TPR repeat protein
MRSFRKIVVSTCGLAILLVAGPAGSSPAAEQVKKADDSKLLELRKAAEQGNPNAQCDVGRMYAEGQGVPQDYAEAQRWWRKAAEQGHAGAQSNLGLMYDTGKGVPQDHAEALRWYRKAAEQGNANAQYFLGQMYAKGRGVRRDYAEALRWYRKAAEQRHASAQYSLGFMYANGKGVRRDYLEAHIWRNLAASRASGDRAKWYTEVRDRVAKKMTPKQIAEAQRRAREWKPKSGADKRGKLAK